MLIVPLQPVYTQTLSVTLAQQACKINVYQKSTGLFVDLYVNDVLIIGGVIALTGVRIVRDAYLGFTGDLMFADMQATATVPQADPQGGAGLGTRWLLMYLEATDITHDV